MVGLKMLEFILYGDWRPMVDSLHHVFQGKKFLWLKLLFAFQQVKILLKRSQVVLKERICCLWEQITFHFCGRSLSRRAAEIILTELSVLKEYPFSWSFPLPIHNICYLCHYENMPIQIYWKVNHRKIENFQTKIQIFFIFLLKT